MTRRAKTFPKPFDAGGHPFCADAAICRAGPCGAQRGTGTGRDSPASGRVKCRARGRWPTMQMHAPA